MGAKGKPRDPGSGRKPGTPNKNTQDLMAKCEELQCDPFQILLYVAKADWKALGYESGQKVKTISEDNGPIFEDQITLEARLKAAKDLCEYLYPKRKALEVSGAMDAIHVIIEDYTTKKKSNDTESK